MNECLSIFNNNVLQFQPLSNYTDQLFLSEITSLVAIYIVVYIKCIEVLAEYFLVN